MAGVIKQRIAVVALTLSAAAFGAWKASEGYTDHAVIPVQGDRPTIGHGSTFYEDGRPVRLGDTITPRRAETLARNLLSADEKRLAASLPGVELLQGEFDLYMQHIGHHGIGNWYKPKSPRTWLLRGDYAGACEAIKNWRFVAGYDCSTVIDGRRNRRCWGVWLRVRDRSEQCAALQQ